MRKLLFCFLLLILVSACEQNFQSNSIKNVERCIKKNGSDLVDKNVTRNNCVEKISKKVSSESSNITGKARPLANYSKTVHNGDVVNKSNDIIYTSFTIEFVHTINYPETISRCEEFVTCKTYTFEKKYKDLWLQPSEKMSFTFTLNEENLVKPSKLEHFMAKDKMVGESTDKQKYNWKWHIEDAKGISLNKIDSPLCVINDVLPCIIVLEFDILRL